MYFFQHICLYSCPMLDHVSNLLIDVSSVYFDFGPLFGPMKIFFALVMYAHVFHNIIIPNILPVVCMQ